jgi:hypothetical protein
MPAASASCGEPNTTGSPAQRISPASGLRPGQHLDQGRLPGAVLAEQAVHLARRDVEVDVVERADARELLDDAAHLQQRLAVVRVRGRVGHGPPPRRPGAVQAT